MITKVTECFLINIPFAAGWSLILAISFALIYGILFVLGAGASMLCDWVDDEESDTANLFSLLMLKIRGYSLSPSDDDYCHKEVKERIYGAETGRILLENFWFFVFIPFFVFLVVHFFYLVLGVSIVMGVLYLTRYTRRIQKTVKKHIDDKRVHK